MKAYDFAQINLKATGLRIKNLREQKGLSVKDLQDFFGFSEPQAIYKWQWGKTLPSIDNFFALSQLLDTTIDNILVTEDVVVPFLLTFMLIIIYKLLV